MKMYFKDKTMQNLSNFSLPQIASFVAAMSSEQRKEFTFNLTLDSYLRYLESQHLKDTPEALPLIILGHCLPCKYRALFWRDVFFREGQPPDDFIFDFGYFFLEIDPNTNDFLPTFITTEREEALVVLEKAAPLPHPLSQHLVETREQARDLASSIFTPQADTWSEGACGQARDFLTEIFGRCWVRL